jgi:hypothetical protein
MERAACDSKTRPTTEIKILECEVFNNPFNEEFVPDDERKRRAEQAKRDEEEGTHLPDSEKVVGTWFSAPGHALTPVSSGIGKYISMGEQPQTV